MPVKKKEKAPKETKVAKEKVLPTPLEMKEFGIQFDKPTWDKLCQHREFMDAVCSDLSMAQELAAKLLKKKKAVPAKKYEEEDGDETTEV